MHPVTVEVVDDRYAMPPGRSTGDVATQIGMDVHHVGSSDVLHCLHHAAHVAARLHVDEHRWRADFGDTGGKRHVGPERCDADVESVAIGVTE